MNYRRLHSEEIALLLSRGCSSDDWSQILVAENFASDRVCRVHFGATAHPEYPFAQGLPVEVLDETGSLVVPIYDTLSYQQALACIAGETVEVPMLTLPSGEVSVVIEADVTLCDIRVTRDTYFHSGACAQGASRLDNCSVFGHIGDRVCLDSVIVLDHSHVYDGACLDHTFVGQGCHIGRMFSATQSLFFACCHFENGEACAYLAGPYSVSHHKSTLMIACMTSFFNAGSGSNQSNHSYKLGPNKYGILERGAKLGSSSYLYWPARVGEFSTVIGHHFTHFDLHNLPFSLILEKEGETHVVPGHILGSCGLRRDVAKWPKRDTRGESRLDDIDFSLFQPQTVAALERGLLILRDMHARACTTYQGCTIAGHHVERGIQWYELALRVARHETEAEAEWAALLDADAARDEEAYIAQRSLLPSGA